MCLHADTDWLLSSVMSTVFLDSVTKLCVFHIRCIRMPESITVIAAASEESPEDERWRW